MISSCAFVSLSQGCAYLYIPNVFDNAGLVVGVLVVCGLASLCNLSKDLLLVSLARLEALAAVGAIRMTDSLDLPPVETHGTHGAARRFRSNDFVISHSRRFEVCVD